MHRLIMILCALFGFLLTYMSTPWLIFYLKKIDLLVKDQHKEGNPLVPISGGLSVLFGLMGGLMLFMFFRTFIPGAETNIVLGNTDLSFLYAALITILIITFVGFVDDLLIRKSRDASAGLRQWQKPLLTLTAAIPLMVVSAGESLMAFPFIGHVEFGLLYPLFLVPIGVVGAANMVNLLGGFNGLETGMGIIYMGSLGFYAYVHESYIASLIAIITFAVLVAFYFYNKYPSKIFAGDSLTYLLGATIAAIAIVGNLEKAAFIVSMPFILEFVLKLRGKFQKTTVGYVKDGKVFSKYDKVYSLPHFFTRTGKFTEKQIVWFILLIQLIFAGLIWVI